MGLLVTHEKENVSPTRLIYGTLYCVWMQREGASFVPSQLRVCVLGGGLMSKQEEVSDGPGTHLWDTTTGELSVSVSVCPLHPLSHPRRLSSIRHSSSLSSFPQRPAWMLSRQQPPSCRLCAPVSCLHLLAHTHTYKSIQKPVEALIMSN